MANSRETPDDEFLWLEEVEGVAAVDWVRARNAESEGELFGTDDFEKIRVDTLEVLEADDRIAYPSRHGDVVHNFWTDSSHRRGLLRRTTWEDYRSGDPDWETILDIDALCENEDESWVFHGSATRRPDRRRALIELSPGGSDASVTREFDLVEKRFVPAREGEGLRVALFGKADTYRGGRWRRGSRRHCGAVRSGGSPIRCRGRCSANCR